MENRTMITYRTAKRRYTRQYIIVPSCYVEEAKRYVIGQYGGKVLEVREPHATQGIIIPIGWALSDEIRRYWNALQLVNYREVQ